MRRHLVPVLFLMIGSLLSSIALAARAPAHLRGRSELEVASGAPARGVRRLAWDAVPASAKKSFATFERVEGGQWRSAWDAATGVPTRIYGSGIVAPGTIASPEVADKFARDVLLRNLALLAPGADVGDFKLAANHLHRGIRTVAFVQSHEGLSVVGGQLSFRFKNDRLFVIASEALPTVNAKVVKPIGAARARERAQAWIDADFSTTSRASTVGGPMVLPIVRSTSRTGVGVDYSVVLAVRVDSQQPIGRWTVYVDAETGANVARRNLLRFAEGTVLYNAPERWPGGSRADYPAYLARLTIDDTTSSSDEQGLVSWAGDAAATVVTMAVGTLVRVFNDSGSGANATTSLEPDGQLVWDLSADAVGDAQVATFVHSNIAKEYARELNPELAWLDQELIATVNINEFCNAFSDGESIYFFLGDLRQCANTGRLADVIYHEFGHSLHAQSIIPGAGGFDGGLSEGISDYFAATITNDPAMGRGFFLNAEPLRHIDPDAREYRWPEDVGESHETGLIIAGALWDLRKSLIETMGEEAGVAHADQIFYAVIQRSTDIPAALIEALAYDDDDGNLDNGTPNGCAILEAFAAHGLNGADATGQTLSVKLPIREGWQVTVPVLSPMGECPTATVAGVELGWQLRSDPLVNAVEDLELVGDSYSGAIPTQAEGEVVQYTVIVTFADGTVTRFPNNEADPYYELFNGELEPLYCTGFETNINVDGWTHGVAAGEGSDEWEQGPVFGNSRSADPLEAYEGTYVFGIDLGSPDPEDFRAGRYGRNTTTFAESPVVDLLGHQNARLQYRRWLTVEDGEFDQASIYGGDELLWSNHATNLGGIAALDHLDREWRFHDVDLTSAISDGSVQFRFELAADDRRSYGGWTVDELCVLAFVPSTCGDGEVTGNETCDAADDNSDVEPDACRESCVVASCGDGVIDTGEECDDENNIDDDLCSNECIGEPPPSGCGCRTGSGSGGGLPLAILAFGLFLWRRRR